MSRPARRPIPLVSYSPPYGPRTAALPPRPEHHEALRNADEVFTVASSAVDRMAYDTLTETLFVTWTNGKTYAYDDVPPSKWRAFQDAASKGKFANFAVKFNHPGYGPL